ncbi:MAG: hypothetical protein ABSD47_18560 [Candidatus Methylomirabilota bacterium]|jgi:hypothetical protein
MPCRTYQTPEEATREVTKKIILRAIKMAKKKGRTIHIGKTAREKGVDVATLDPRTPEGSRRLGAFLTPVRRQYTWYGLGPPEESNAISWRSLNLPLWRRALVGLQVSVSLFMKGTPLKNIPYRWMGAHIGKNVEITQDRLQLDCVEVVWYEVGGSVQAHAQPGPEGGVP